MILFPVLPFTYTNSRDSSRQRFPSILIMSAEPTPTTAASNPSLSSSAYMVNSVDKLYSSDEEVASLPSVSTSDSDMETLSDGYSDAEEEWRESIEQLELLLSMVLVPFVGKYLGRKCAYWSMYLFISSLLVPSSLEDCY